jgi:ATP-dependent DNA helicase RecG
MDLAELQMLIAAGESETVEFKQSTAQLARVGETLCGFLNASGGEVLIGIAPTGKLVGQQVSDSTLRDIAAILDRFEPPVHIAMQRIQVEQGRQVIVLRAPAESESVPFTYNGRAYQRIGSTTSVMPQERYQQLLLERSYSQHRWENRPAIEVKLTDLDDEEILRTVRLGIEAGRMPEITGSDTADILDRLGIRQHGQILHAAVVLFGSNFLPDYPQCQLRMARFKGIDKSEFLDQRQLYGHASIFLARRCFSCAGISQWQEGFSPVSWSAKMSHSFLLPPSVKRWSMRSATARTPIQAGL